MPVRTVTITVEKTQGAGRFLLDAGEWAGKPRQLHPRVVIPVWADSPIGKRDIFRIWVYQSDPLENLVAIHISDEELAKIDPKGVTRWWNEMADRWLLQLESQHLIVAPREEIDTYPTIDL